jgi:hypothetical protein
MSTLHSSHNTHTFAGSSDDFSYWMLAPSWDTNSAFWGGTEPVDTASTLAPNFSAIATAAAPAQILYLSEVKGAAAISVTDINQHQIGDCFLLSSIGEIAILNPTLISNMIHINANGTETVLLYAASNGTLPTPYTRSFKPVTETVTNVFPTYSVNSGIHDDTLAGQKEIWVQILEKAVAQLDSGVKASATLTGIYSSIMNGGSPLVAMAELTGQSTSYMSPSSMSLATLIADQNAGDMIVFDTNSGGTLTNGLFNRHAYMFAGVTGTGASAAIHLDNPWGYDHPLPLTMSQISKNFAEIDIGHYAHMPV